MQSDAYSYIRFSFTEQRKGNSFDRQTGPKAEDWCRRNNAVLDTNMTLHDLGKSAFKKRRKGAADDSMASLPELNELVNPDRRALAGFLECIRRRKIRRGAYLIIENLDRLSREDIVPAAHLLLSILVSGVKVVQLLPERSGAHGQVRHGRRDNGRH